MNRQEIVASIEQRGAVAVVRMNDSSQLLAVAEAICEGGVSVLEITMTTPNALQVIEQLATRKTSDFIVGVGSVLNPNTAKAAIDAGAQFVVSPIFKPEVVRICDRMNTPVMPGAFTPTEIQIAHEEGADVVKVFPANIVGMAFFKGVLAPMPHLKLMPTGGVTLDNAGDWLKAGACAVGVGSALMDKKAIDSGDYEKLKDNARRIVKSIQTAR
ncbi:MAG: bifunctional 4-hydroxy-2-oxoglutarate aldolase/2-dehydro-3-deoxy-phosphogluconate aldolase [Calditrichia bacterium]